MTKSYIEKLPSKNLEDAVAIRDWLLVNNTNFMAYLLIRRFNSCCEWAINSQLIPDNPFSKLRLKKPRRKSTDDDYKAFTEQQRDIIIEAFENHNLYSHYAPLIKFLFFTGCRLGEAFALTWGDINSDCTRIKITKSRNQRLILKGTKNGKKRVFPCGVGSKLQQLLLSIRPDSYTATQLIFTTPKGKLLSSQILNTVWNQINGRSLGVVRELEIAGKVPYLRPYAARHTFATLALAKGVKAIELAKWMGDEVDTVHKYYSHASIIETECPDI
ncbi:MAG TPA: site-specific integrase [Nostocaceae cyanobacterium]|nr:site-specific integrase [Nostocaceae cyanobacterium]